MNQQFVLAEHPQQLPEHPRLVLIWLISTLVLSVWTFRFGVALMRADESHVQLTEPGTSG